MIDGYEFRQSSGKGKGVFATKSFAVGDLVVLGVIQEVLSANTTHATQIGESEYVLLGELMSLVNHSCGPNCGIRVNETGAHDLIALCDISAHEEITYDYAMSNYGVNFFSRQCMCGSKKCRGEITGWKDLSEEIRKEYEGFVAPSLSHLNRT